MSTTVHAGTANRGPVGTADRDRPADPWALAQSSAEFATLRGRLRKFVFPMTLFFLAWYFAYVLLAAFAPHLMVIKVIGNLNTGLIFGLLQFVSTFAITMIYVRFANRKLDPISSRIRDQVEGGTR
jgi:uncharacterized membrane protein (DUF485 family)